MFKRLFLLVIVLLVAVPASFSVLAQDDLTETLELPEYGFTMSYPDGWDATDDPATDGFASIAEDGGDIESIGSLADLTGQLVLIIPLPTESLEALGEEPADRLVALSENFGAEVRTRDVDQVDIEGGYDTFVAVVEVDDAFVIAAEIDGEEGFSFFVIAAAPADAADDLQANVVAMFDTIELSEPEGGDTGGDTGGDVDLGDAESIEYGDSVEGEISDDSPIIVYAFEGEEGDVVTITMIDTSRGGELDPYLVLMNEDGDVLEENDDADDSDAVDDTLDSQIAEFELPDDGVYTIVATRFGQENGGSEGEFELTLDEGEGGGGDGGDTGGDTGGDAEFIAIEYGDSVSGEITDDAVFVFYTFEASEGDVVTITMIDTDEGDLDPYLGLLDENGDVITENDDAESGARLDDSFDSQITEFEIEEDGVYTIVATRYNFEDGSGEGEFELTLESE